MISPEENAKKDKKHEAICLLGVYILHMYVYYKGDRCI